MAKNTVKPLTKRELTQNIYVTGNTNWGEYHLCIKMYGYTLEIHETLQFAEPVDGLKFADFRAAQAVVNAIRAEYARRYYKEKKNDKHPTGRLHSLR